MSDAPSLITLTEPLSPVSEAYRTLRMNILFASQDQPVRSLLVVSPSDEGGDWATTTLANLAVTLAQIERQVIVVDGNLRAPSLHRLFGLTNEAGLTTMMSDQDALAHPPLCATGVPGLRLLPSGPLPVRAPDLLGSKRMDQVLETLHEEADLVLFAAPSLLAVTDGAILASKVDGVLLVVTAGGTKREHAQSALQQLQRVHARVIGAVLANAPADA